MSGMLTKQEIKALNSKITRLLNKSIITQSEATTYRDLVMNNPLKLKKLMKDKLSSL